MQRELKYKNQIHPPSKKKKRVDINGNDYRKLWFKDGTSTMLFAKDLTENMCKLLINRINSTLIAFDKKPLTNKFIITK